VRGAIRSTSCETIRTVARQRMAGANSTISTQRRCGTQRRRSDRSSSTTESQRRYLIEITWFFKNAPFLKNPIISTTSSNCRHSSTSRPRRRRRDCDVGNSGEDSERRAGEGGPQRSAVPNSGSPPVRQRSFGQGFLRAVVAIDMREVVARRPTLSPARFSNQHRRLRRNSAAID
jgi:hypothetical protein